MSTGTAVLIIDDSFLFVDPVAIPQIQWESETVLPSGAIVRKCQGIECISTPFHTEGWDPK